jgi:hypothetical protein
VTAAPGYTVDQLVTKFQNRYLNPNSNALFQAADIISLMDDCLRETIIPVITSVREEFWVKTYDQPVTGASSYTIPSNAAGAVLRDVVFVDTAGNEIDLQQLSPAHIKATFPFGYQLPLYTFGYYWKNDQIVPYPQQTQNALGYTLRMKPIRRPNDLTSSANCGQITVIAGNVLTLTNVDPSWTATTTFDIIQNFPQFTSIVDGATITGTPSGSNITLTTVPAGLAVGMWVCPTTTSCIPQIPYEGFGLLIEDGICKMCASLGDSQGFGLHEKIRDKMRQDFIDLITPRSQLGTKKIVNRNNPMSFWNFGSPFIR